MKRISLMFCGIFFALLLEHAVAEFDWGGSCEGGRGTFQQQIEHYGNNFENAVTIGTIPSGLKNVYVSLKSDKDVDIRLYDVNGKKIIHWPYGILKGATKQSMTYKGTTIEYSGYNGDGSGSGNEYIKIQGVTPNGFIMKAFGYNSGYAKVDYSWEGKSGCDNSSSITRNSGHFMVSLREGKRSYLGLIPAGTDNPVVFLNATKDLDIELYDAATNEFVVGWNSGHLNYFGLSNEIYKNDKITWSGYSGRYALIYEDKKSGIDESAEKGREYIRIHGKSKNGYEMYAFAYESGNAEVEYSWGINIIYAGILGMGIDYLNSNSNNDPGFALATNGIMPAMMESFYGPSYKGYGHTVKQANRLANGINLSFVDGEEYVATKNMKGQVGIAIKLSNYARGAGDINIYTSGNVQYIFNKIKSQINENVNNVLFVSGHSSGGGDAQDILWKFNEIGQPVKASFQIDSVETELSNWGDARIPANTEYAYNYYENEVWYANFGPRENYIYAADSSKTTIQNKHIDDPACNTDGKWTCKEDGHEAIDNDMRVWGDILTKMKKHAGIKGDFFE